ncbi:ethanolamine ammonia-lyase subunit EutC [Teichococcus vastitatis]|uniref:Ethanolamine ammonia-lyase small subunit n=1 Tax=Teichococcus vastitatis TaxID=2307076 RepID=A0ABS9WAX5_9PROT|nr:ethanolamine ammonia-lyase subunit EutC [Pseudoroseomonas vastitatis]MCI0756040.1 ethanolamine ammonia-lyase subunit EutC [Pseudoroseomonas vastitatis]
MPRDAAPPMTSPADDPWAALRRFTPARIGLGRAGDAPPLGAVLDFQLAHARARDAVHAALDRVPLQAALGGLPWLAVRSQAPDRGTYLRRPDLGRRLDPECLPLLPKGEWDAVFVLADGLSATAVQQHAAAVLRATLQRLPGWRVAPVVIATQARVALGDEIGEALGASLCAMLIGERPGLSVADSLGVYLTYAPQRGRRDSERNCISNIHRSGGLAPESAADKLAWLMTEALRLRLTGVELKDEQPPHLEHGAPGVGSRPVLGSGGPSADRPF